MLPIKIVSGGQTGADQAALEFAIAQGIEPGGWCPKGKRCEGGSIPVVDFDRFHLKEATTRGYEERTRLNVADSDATVIFNQGPNLSAGCGLTASCCRALQRPCRVFRLQPAWFVAEPDQQAVAAEGLVLARFLAFHRPKTLNIAGNRESTTPGIGRLVRAVMASAWEQYEAVVTAKLAQEVQPSAPIVASKPAAPGVPAQMDLFSLPDSRDRGSPARCR